MKRYLLLSIVAIALVGVPVLAQGPAQIPQAGSARAWVSEITANYRVVPEVTYLTASGAEQQLDLYLPRAAAGETLPPNPVVIFIHGGGWTGGNRLSSSLNVLPYMEMGFSVVNISYRLARVALAPAAVEDARCALRWVIANAKQYGFDTTKIITTGQSAGGHLALTTAMLPPDSEFDRECFGPEALKVAGVVNWYGITDVADLIDGTNRKTYAVRWLSSLPNRADLARKLSPLTYVRAGLPPILSIQGDADPTVPYAHNTRLRDALTQAGVPNQLHTVPGGGHGNFKPAEYQQAYAAVRAFLAKHNLMPSRTTATNN
jgi:acetyl esterase/lipase